MTIELNILEKTGVERLDELVEFSVPLPEGAHAMDTPWSITGPDGKALPSQIRALQPYPDGTTRALHGWFKADVPAGGALKVQLESGSAPEAGPALLRQELGVFSFDTGPMQAHFSVNGELISWVHEGRELLYAPSLGLTLGLGPAGWSNGDMGGMAARIKENGPLRAVLNVSGVMKLGDMRGEVEMQVDVDIVAVRGETELHISCLVGSLTEAVQINMWGYDFQLKNGRELRYGGAEEVVRPDPNTEMITWRAIPEGWATWALPEGDRLSAWSPDFASCQNGMFQTDVIDEKRDYIYVSMNRVEKQWGYIDVSQVAKPIVIARGSSHRFELHLGLSQERTGADFALLWKNPLRARPAPEVYRQGLSWWLEGEVHDHDLKEKVHTKCFEFICTEPEYAGSLHGGYDGPNGIYIERGVSRGDFGEYLFNEYYRSGDEAFYKASFDFGRIYRDIYCFTLQAVSTGPWELGGARGRASEYWVCFVRSYRGAVLLAYMYQETGDERYLEAIKLRADYHMHNYPHNIGRMSMSTRDTAFMGQYLNRPELCERAKENALFSMKRHFDPVAGYYEVNDHKSLTPDGRHKPWLVEKGKFFWAPWKIEKGMWFMKDFLPVSNASPEMTAYNIIGWYGLWKLGLLEGEIRERAETISDWFMSVQKEEGSWPYPHYNSETRWGHGSLQDAMAMLYAYRMFGKEAYLTSAEKSIDFSRRMFAEHGRIPLLLGLLPQEATEDSLTYYYGVETLAVYEMIRQERDPS